MPIRMAPSPVPPAASSRHPERRAGRICKLTAAFSDGENLFAVRYATDAHAPTLYTREAQPPDAASSLSLSTAKAGAGRPCRQQLRHHDAAGHDGQPLRTGRGATGNGRLKSASCQRCIGRLKRPYPFRANGSAGSEMTLSARYTELGLVADLTDEVEAVWTSVSDRAGSYRVLPDGRCDIILRFDAGQKPITDMTVVITGPITRFYDVAIEPGMGFVGVRIRPGCFERVLGFNRRNWQMPI